jgi:FtsP/CotA-like multicopper oxidase with cupredoxin domain
MRLPIPITTANALARIALAVVLIAPPGAFAQVNTVHPPLENPNDVLGAGLRGGGDPLALCDVPTSGALSPDFGAEPFTQMMFREEGFGTSPLAVGDPATCIGNECPQTFVPPTDALGNFDAYSTQDDALVLDRLINQPLHPEPTRMANATDTNPWQTAIEQTHTGPLLPLSTGGLTSYAEGRPPGEFYAHQRWEEFYPTRQFTTIMAGSRTNTGARDGLQFHLYEDGEFGPGGLYHNTVHGIRAQTECAAIVDQATCETHANVEASADDFMCKWEAGVCSGKFNGTTNGIAIKFHPAMPVQSEQSIWTFDGTLPPKLLMARYSEPILFRHYNALPIKYEANRGFGSHFITTHEHNGHNPAESDGYAEAYFLPGQFYDYHWPMQLAGRDTVDNHPLAGTPCDPGEQMVISIPSPQQDAAGNVCDYGARLAENVTGDPAACGWRREARTCDNGRIPIPGDPMETMSTHWFHDHMLDHTAQNVYKGNAAMMNYYSAIDRANECADDGVNLRLPSGCGLGRTSWGNRDYDVNIILATKAWGQDTDVYPGNGDATTEGQLWFDKFEVGGFVGDMMTANLLYKPFFNVRQRSYRFRLLNGDVSRFMKLAVVVQRLDDLGEFPGEQPGISYDRVAAHLVANDGNIMEHSIPLDGSMDLDRDGDLLDHFGILPLQSIAERWDLIIDFDRYAPGTKLYLVNILEHEDGKKPNQEIPLGDILSGLYNGCDRAVGKALELRVHACTRADGTPAASCQVGGDAVLGQQDHSMDPDLYRPGNTNGANGTAATMIPMPTITAAELAGAVHRTFEFGRGAASDNAPVTITPAEFADDSPDAFPAPSNAGDFGWVRNGEAAVHLEIEDLKELIVGGGVAAFPDQPWGQIVDDNGDMLIADLGSVSAAPQLGDLEVWHFINGGNGWSHNVHIHFEEGRILTRDGEAPPEWEKWARKDVFRVGPMDESSRELALAIRFREFGGSYMEHCHNTQHEDHAMLVRWDIENPGQLKPLLTPAPQWNGVTFVESRYIPTASAQNSAVVGNPAAKADWEDAVALDDALCPVGATGTNCAGAAKDVNPAPDADTDGVFDFADNCIWDGNPTQFDGDNDGFGNVCDGDFNNDGQVNFGDLAMFAEDWHRVRTNPGAVPDPVCDMSRDNQMNFADFARFVNAFGKAPGSAPY